VNGRVCGFGVTTDRGKAKSSNEDRAVAVLACVGEEVGKHTVSYFAVFDGHGGAGCSQFLQSKLIDLLLDSPDFPEYPESALKDAIQEADCYFRHIYRDGTRMPDPSGSCAIICLVVDSIAYIANTGDSRAILSLRKGSHSINLSKEHRPSNHAERQRVKEAGGAFYRKQFP
jgi:protein phosphatase 2C family protein 2/3